jgi:Zn-dependent protease with chaperone function
MPELDALRALLPIWARAPGLLLLPAAFGVGFAVTAAAIRAALWRTASLASAHWTERARAALPARWAGSLAAVSAGASFAGLAAHQAGPLLLAPVWLTALAAGIAAYLGSGCALARLEASLGLGPRGWVGFARGRLVQLLVVLPHCALIVILACTIGGSLDAADLAATALGVSAYALLAVWGGLPLARCVGALHPASPRLRSAVERAATRTGIAPAAVYEADLPGANAFAFPLPRWLVFTPGCTAALDDAALECVACHELAHLAEPQRVKAARVAASFTLLPLAFAPALVASFGWLGLGGVYALVFGASVPLHRLSRHMEGRADAIAAGGEAEPGAYARALEALHERNLAPAVGWSAGGAHPHLYDRMEAAGLVPAYPRPAPPSRVRAFAGGAVALVALVLLTAAVAEPRTRPLAGSASRAALDVALFGGSPDAFFELAAHGARRAPGDAETLLRAALAVRTADHAAHALLAQKLAELGRCAEAAAAREAAERLLAEPRWQDHASTCPWLTRATQAIAVCG